ncbi:MAG: hypothetical protein J0L94_10830 [Rhodothermia bacterium]|nr:hypothetical protein [Rhodothermia bacterium]
MQENLLIDTLLGLSSCRYGVEKRTASFQMQTSGASEETWMGKASFYPAKRFDSDRPALRLQCYTHQQKGFIFHVPTIDISEGQQFNLSSEIHEDALLLLLSGFDGLLVPSEGILTFEEVNKRFYTGRFSLILRKEFQQVSEKALVLNVEATFKATPGWPNFDLLIGGVHCLN